MRTKRYLVNEDDMLDILNMLTYNYYAKLWRKLRRNGIKRRPTYHEYRTECDRYMSLPSISDKAWRHGYDFIADLFDDNEMYGTPCDPYATTPPDIDDLLDDLLGLTDGDQQ